TNSSSFAGRDSSQASLANIRSSASSSAIKTVIPLASMLIRYRLPFSRREIEYELSLEKRHLKASIKTPRGGNRRYDRRDGRLDSSNHHRCVASFAWPRDTDFRRYDRSGCAVCQAVR